MCLCRFSMGPPPQHTTVSRDLSLAAPSQVNYDRPGRTSAGGGSPQGPYNGAVAVPSLARVLPAEGQGEVDVELLEEELAEGGAVADVDPVADGGVLLLALALARDDVVVALGAGYGARQPDLLVGGLLVDHVGAEVREDEGEDAGRVLNLDGLVLVGKSLQLRQDDLKVRVGHLVVLRVGEIGGNGLDTIVLDIGRERVVGVGKDASGLGGRR